MQHPIETLRLKHGTLNCTALACGKGPLVLLLHGFPDNAHTWRHQLPFLAQAGYRAVALTLRGYEPESVSADGDYTQASIATDVIAALDALGVERAHLVGHDWGAAIAYHTAAVAPRRLASLTTLAVPHPGRFLTGLSRHPRQLRLSWYMLFFQARGLAEWSVRRNDYAFIRMLYRQWSPGWAIPAGTVEGVIDTLRQPGVLTAALGYYRAALAVRALPLSAAARAAAVFKVPVPTLALAGNDDGCIDAEVFRDLMHADDFPAGLRVETIPRAGHFLHQEQASVFNALLADWLVTQGK